LKHLLTPAYRLKGRIDIPARAVRATARLPQRRIRLGSATFTALFALAEEFPKDVDSLCAQYSGLEAAPVNLRPVDDSYNNNF